MTATRRDMAAHSPCSNIQSCFVRRSILLLVLLSSITFLAGLGRPAVGDSDEAFYAEAGREMVELGDWLTPIGTNTMATSVSDTAMTPTVGRPSRRRARIAGPSA